MALKQMEPTVEEICGMKFYITPFPAFKAANLTGELASVLIPIFGILAPFVNDWEEGDSEENDKGRRDINARKAAEAMSGSPDISGDKLEKLMRKLLLGGTIIVEIPNEEGETDAQRLDQDLADELFCGEVQEMFLLCFYVIRLNFKGFFKRFTGLFGKEKPPGEEEGKRPRKIL